MWGRGRRSDFQVGLVMVVVVVVVGGLERREKVAEEEQAIAKDCGGAGNKGGVHGW